MPDILRPALQAAVSVHHNPAHACKGQQKHIFCILEFTGEMLKNADANLTAARESRGEALLQRQPQGMQQRMVEAEASAKKRCRLSGEKIAAEFA
ncbi:hypothetical protein cyc_08974 [Cyclospora cayetanensis]|uniref:Uncharacterized protein n=1 Tax=Cyclospora cayetanensis TaxID=88456 RepID=A0A1D3CVB3_9EIME|nr:hypothetical protein cyc_08974 [Cyclospora cayetanensis]